jgi:hypothetical protein
MQIKMVARECNLGRHLTDRQSVAVNHQGAVVTHQGAIVDRQGAVIAH